MDKNDRPTIHKGSTIYCMVNYRNHRLLFTAVALFAFGAYLAYGAISSRGPQNLYSLTFVLLVLETATIALYLYVKRSREPYNHPDVQRFLGFNDPGRALDLFEREAADDGVKRFKNGFVTRSFTVTESAYHFPWTFNAEIAGARVRRTIWGISRIPLFSPYQVIISLADGNRIPFNCACKKEAENLMKTMPAAVPRAPKGNERDVTAKSHLKLKEIIKEASSRMKPAEFPDCDFDQINALVSGTAETGPVDSPEKRNGPSSPETKPKTKAAGQPRPAGDERLYSDQISRLYRSLDAGDTGTSAGIIDDMGDAANVEAADILILLLEDPEEPIRAHAALALGKLRPKAAVEPLIALLDDRSASVRENAAIALGMIGDNRAEIPLQKVGIDNPRVKRAAVNALTRIDGRRMRTF